MNLDSFVDSWRTVILSVQASESVRQMVCWNVINTAEEVHMASNSLLECFVFDEQTLATEDVL